MDTYPTSMTMPEFVLKVLMFSPSVQLDGLLHLEICEATTLWIAWQGFNTVAVTVSFMLTFGKHYNNSCSLLGTGVVSLLPRTAWLLWLSTMAMTSSNDALSILIIRVPSEPHLIRSIHRWAGAFLAPRLP